MSDTDRVTVEFDDGPITVGDVIEALYRFNRSSEFSISSFEEEGEVRHNFRSHAIAKIQADRPNKVTLEIYRTVALQPHE